MIGDTIRIRWATARQAAGRWWLLAGVLWVTYLGLSAAVRLGLLDGLDGRLAQWGRPDEVWLTRQQRLSPFVDDFRPVLLSVALAVLTLVVTLVRRSLRPAVLVAVTGLGALLVAAGTKVVVGRPDVQGAFYNHGSFPSGHALAAVLCSGLALLLLWPKPRWWHLVLPVFPGSAMAVCLVVIGMHWSSDALGSILLGTAALAFAAGWTVAMTGAPQAGRGTDRAPLPERGIRSR